VALENALLTARVEGGGTVRFRCGDAPVTIALSASTYVPDLEPLPVALTPPTNTIIDGGGLVTLVPVGSMTDAYFLFVDRNTTVTIENLSVRGWTHGTRNRGTLVVWNVAFSEHLFAIIQNENTLRFENSSVSGGAHQVAIGNAGDALIDHSDISNFGSVGATVSNTGTLTVKNSIFAGNGNESLVIDNVRGTTSIYNCEFSRNHTFGGAIGSRSGSLTVINSTFSENVALNGGAMSTSGGTVVVRNSQFLNNLSTTNGGAINNMGGLFTLQNSTVSGNHAREGYGGGISNGATFIAINSLITSNRVSLFFGGGIYSTGSLQLTRTDVIGNTPDDIWEID